MNWRAPAIGGAVGLAVALAALAYFALAKEGADAVLFVWPSSVMLMGAENVPPSEEWRVLVPSILINVLLYAFLGGAFAAARAKEEG